MTTVDGQYFDGRRPVGAPAKIVFEGEEVSLTTGIVSDRYLIRNLKISPRIGSAKRFINLPNGAQFVCADRPFFDSLPQESPSEGPVAWLEKRWGIALVCVAIIACTLLAGYFIGLPVAAEKIAWQIPIQTEQSLGKEALNWLDKNKWFQPTTLDAQQMQTINFGFKWISRDLPFKEYYRLEFRSGKMFGPNAFALPGGIIVITDDMVKLAQNTEEIVAILAHEIGHVELRHAMRSVLQNSAVAVVAATLTADAASLSVAVAGLPALLAQTKYSRKFEAAADEYSFRLLKEKGYSPVAFASIMERLAEKYEKNAGAFAYISTHPVTAKRIQRARAAAAE